MSRGKRLLDLTGAIFGLALLWPLFLVIAALIRLDDRGPVFFRQERLGAGAMPFRIWKFRSMRSDAPALGGPLTIAGDPRVTRVGWFLRRTKVDELPQLINVLTGEMSLVGPRPEVARYVAHYTLEQRRALTLVPGITDPASLAFVHEERLLAEAADPELVYIDKIMPEKIRLNLDYAAGATVLTDLQMITRTIVQLFRQRRMTVVLTS